MPFASSSCSLSRSLPLCVWACLRHQAGLAKEAAAAKVGAPPPAHTLKAATQLQGQRKAGLIKRMQVVLFMARELLPMRLYPALMSLLVSTGSFASEKDAETGNMATDDGMVCSTRAAHKSEKAGWQFMESLSWVSRRTIREEMGDAPTIAATQDETLDCANKSQQITFYVYPFQKMGSMIKVQWSTDPIHTPVPPREPCRVTAPNCSHPRSAPPRPAPDHQGGGGERSN